jgi:hypothetical protein
MCFQQHLACDLERLGELLYMDMDSGLSQLREGLPRILKKRTSLEKAGDCAPFFEAYRSPKGKALSKESVHKLAALASSFPSGEEASRNEVELEKNMRPILNRSGICSHRLKTRALYLSSTTYPSHSTSKSPSIPFAAGLYSAFFLKESSPSHINFRPMATNSNEDRPTKVL